MTPAQNDRQRERHLHDNMQPMQVERHQQRNLIVNMTPAQIENQRQRSRTHRRGFVSMLQEWDYDNLCPHCDALYLKSDIKSSRNICCHGGKWVGPDSSFPKLEPLPYNLRFLSIERVNHFSTKCAFYNGLFCVAITGVDNGRQGVGFEKMNMTACVKMNGRSYHYLPNSNLKSCGIANFVYDGLLSHVEEINQNCSNQNDVTINQSFLFDIRDELMALNPYVQDFITIGIGIQQFEVQREDSNVPIANYGTTLNIPTHRMQVGVLLNQDLGNSIVYQYGTNENRRTLDASSGEVEPLCFPLLFPYGERGWGGDLKVDNIHLMAYIAARFLQPEPVLQLTNAPGERVITLNRFQLMSRLSQYYLVEGVSRAMDSQLKYQRAHKKSIFGYSDNVFVPLDGDREVDDDGGSSSFLSDSVMGSPRHRKKLALNGLALTAELGKLHLFTTMTVDPNCAEIMEQLAPGQTAFDRPDVVCRVFHAKKNALINNLKNGHYFGSKCAYIVHVIEYQHRGLPHVHITYRLEDGPDHSNEQECILFIDKYISAQMPVVTAESSDEEIEYFEKVTKYMTHECRGGVVNGCLNDDGICTKGFSGITVDQTSFDEKKYPIYARPFEKDCFVVPHNRQMLLDCSCHVNTEFCASSYAIIYLYKYLFKGNKKIQLALDNLDDVGENDEITMFLRGRMLCSMEAFWRIMNYPTYPASTPPVCTIKMKTLEQLQALKEDKKICDIDIYFARSDVLQDMKYTEFFKLFDYSYTEPKRYHGSVNCQQVATESYQCDV